MRRPSRLLLSLSASAALSLAACQASPPASKSAANASSEPAAASTSAASTTTGTASPGVPSSSDAAIRKAVASLVPDAKVNSIRPTPVPGMVEVTTANDTVYMTADGKYLLTGSLIEVATKRDLTEASRAIARRTLMKSIGPSQMIVFAPPKPKYTVTVFTDVDCGYCRKLHSQIADYNKAGIAVDYLFFPRTGIGSESYDKAVSVWCAPNRQQALTDAKLDKPLPRRNCTNPVTMDYNLGLKFGVNGTPAIYTADGTQIGGYLSPDEMKAKLDKLAAQPTS
ncbi:MAG: thioredoxin fold domain-containing protein [Proteobacteria bacterium]|nr:thioredoxin fold domain-containing protein [Pseudomonadota bacterium]